MTTRTVPKSRQATPEIQEARWVLVGSTALTLLLYAIPQVRLLAYPLMLLSTLAHELGHGMAALLVGGSFHRLSLWIDGSGAAFWSAEPHRLRLATVAVGGLVGPAVAAAFGFWLARRPRSARVVLGVFAGFLALALVLVVRGLFGWLFVAVFAGLCAAAARWADDFTARLLLVFLSVQLALSVFSRADYLFTDVAETGSGPMPSDVAVLADALWLPYWFWGFLCGLLSLAILVFGLRAYWR